MAVAAFNSLTVSKDLQQAGLEDSHAEAIAFAVKQGQGDLATKQDIALLKSDNDQLRSELKSDVDRVKWTIGAILAQWLSLFSLRPDTDVPGLLLLILAQSLATGRQIHTNKKIS